MISPIAFAEFYDNAAGDVFRYLARSVLGNRSVAEDLTQETFTAVVVAAKAGRREALSMPWVMGIAHHKLVDYYRRTATDERHLAGAWAGGSADSCELEVFDREDPGHVLDLLRELSPEYRIVLIMKYVDELSAQEIASALSKTVDATNSLLSRARRALASLLSEDSS